MTNQQSAPIITTLQAIAKIKRYCAASEHCQEEVRQKLRSYGVENEKIENIICDLISENYIDELRYTKAFIKGKTAIKSWGKLKIVNALKQKNISQRCIDIAFQDFPDDIFQEKLEMVAKKWLKTHIEENKYQKKQKLYRFLLSKGYASNDIYQYLNKNEKI